MRYHDWPLRFDNFLTETKRNPFEWKHNCALWVSSGIQIINGDDPAKWFRGKCDTKKEAYQALRDFAKGGDLEQAILKVAEIYEEIPVTLAQRCDAVLLKDEQNLVAAGLVSLDGKHIWHLNHKLRRLLFTKISYGVKAWRIN